MKNTYKVIALLLALIIILWAIHFAGPGHRALAQGPEKDALTLEFSAKLSFLGEEYFFEFGIPATETYVAGTSTNCTVGIPASDVVTMIYCEGVGEIPEVKGYYWNKLFYNMDESVVFATSDSIAYASCDAYPLLSQQANNLSLLLSCWTFENPEASYSYLLELGPIAID